MSDSETVSSTFELDNMIEFDGDLDHDSEMNVWFEEGQIWIDKEDAISLIKHLKSAFKIVVK